jgi:Mg-chelatase subunit ChlD
MRRIWIGLMAVGLAAAACGSDDGADTASGEPFEDVSGAAATTGSATDEAAGGGGDADREALASGHRAAGENEVGLRAGSVDDNAAWAEYLRYRESFAALGIAFDALPVDGRRVLTVTDGAGAPVFDAAITVTGGPVPVVLRTGSDGRAVFLGSVTDADDQQGGARYEATVRHGSSTTTVPIGSAQEQTIVLGDVTGDGDVRLDVLFLVDATGSMDDEIERLKANMVGVAEQIGASQTAPDVRFALTSYRDDSGETGDYVSRTIDFTGDVGGFVSTLEALSAEGGGDTPEALNEAFHEAVHAPRWRTDERVVRLVFLIADAPPHVGRGPSYVDTITAAAAKGIRVYPIASSGTDDQAEFVMRQIAQATLGRFVFLSYGAGGAAVGSGSNIDPDAYDTLALDALVIRLVEEELAPLADR